jgi:polyphosphate kinase
LAGKVYQGQLAKLQIELVKVQAWATESCSLVAIGFEDRDAAGKVGQSNGSART